MEGGIWGEGQFNPKRGGEEQNLAGIIRLWEEWLRSSYPLVKLVGWGEHLPSQVPVDDKTSLCLLQSSHSNDNKYQVFELSCISRITVRGQQGFAVTLNHNPTDGAQVSKFCNLIYANNLPLSLERSLLFLALHTASLSSLYLPLLVCPYLARKKNRWANFPDIYRWIEFFSIVSKVIRHCIGFVSFGSVIGPENSCHSPNQLDEKLKPITTWSTRFPSVSMVLTWSIC